MGNSGMGGGIGFGELPRPWIEEADDGTSSSAREL
jgi:hypothetical protein